jgi:hypothetical protein
MGRMARLFSPRHRQRESRSDRDRTAHPRPARGTSRRRYHPHLGRAAGNGHRVLESLYQRPFVSVDEVQNLTGATYTAANNRVARLASPEVAILQEATGYKRNRVFRYAPYIAIFGDNPSETTTGVNA